MGMKIMSCWGGGAGSRWRICLEGWRGSDFGLKSHRSSGVLQAVYAAFVRYSLTLDACYRLLPKKCSLDTLSGAAVCWWEGFWG